jgi:hypothetical protein
MNEFTCILHGKCNRGTFACDSEELYFGGGYEVCLKEIILPTTWSNVRPNYNWIFVDDTWNKIKKFVYVKPGRYNSYSDLLHAINTTLIQNCKPNCDLFFYRYNNIYYLPIPSFGAPNKAHYDIEEYKYIRKFSGWPNTFAHNELNDIKKDHVIFGCGDRTTLCLVFCPELAILLNLSNNLDVAVPMVTPGWQVWSGLPRWMSNVNKPNVRMLWVLADFIHPTMLGDSKANLLQILPFNITA